MAEPIIINNWQDAIAPSPAQGFGNFRNVDLFTKPGMAMPSKSISSFAATGSSTFTADAGTDVCTAASVSGFGTGNNTGIAVQLTTTGTLPAGLTTSTIYFVIQVSELAGTFKLATTKTNADADSQINITDAGTGTHTITVLAMGTIRQIVNTSGNTADGSAVTYAQDSNGRVWWRVNSYYYLLFGNTITNGIGNGLVGFTTSDGAQTFLFAFRSAKLDVCDVSTNAKRSDPASQWTNDWKTLNSAAGSGNSHYAIVGQDNIIYFADGRFVGSIRELTTFAPGTPATYTFTNQALDMPQGEIISWLEELGQDLLSGGQTYNKIYPWDRRSDTFRLPLACAETGVFRMKNINNTVYILAGLTGRIYKTKGADVSLVARIPEHIIEGAGWRWGGIASDNGDLLFGGAGSADNTTNDAYGVWRLSAEGKITKDSQPPTGSYVCTALTDNYDVGWYQGAGRSGGTRYSSFESVIQTELFKVGTKKKPAQYSEIEVQLAQEASTGNVRVSYRTNINDSPSTLATFTTDGATTSFTADIGLTNIENIQLQVELSCAGSATSALALSELRLIP